MCVCVWGGGGGGACKRNVIMTIDVLRLLLVGGFNETHWKNISQNGNLPQVGVKIKNI